MQIKPAVENENMQAPLQKKDKSGIRFCPRCHAQNLTAQTVCGRCGLVFSSATVKKSEKKGGHFAPEQSAHARATQRLGFPDLSAFGGGEGGGDEGAGGDEETPAEEAPKPKRPNTLPEKGATEGPIREMSGAPACPHCGTEMKDGLKRCPRCGFRIGKR